MYARRGSITPDNSFYASTTLFARATAYQSHVTIVFIPGNPGLIAYYQIFLSALSAHLDRSRSPKNRPSFQVYGRSLGGFDLGQRSAPSAKYYSLEEQICFVDSDLKAFMRESDRRDIGSRKKKRKVILVGHSVGSYIAMEILRRHRERNRGETEAEAEAPDFDIIGGIMLFPTVIDIAKSPAGQNLTRILSFIPQLAILAGFLAALFTNLFSDSVLRYLIRIMMHSPPAEAVDTTLAFLKSGHGVRQAIYMGADEMQSITADKWTDEIWGIGTTSVPLSKPVPQLVFYFGQNDHWVAEQTRNEIIALRGRVSHGPRMLICENGIPHAFCLRHSHIMAKRVAEMIADIVRQ